MPPNCVSLPVLPVLPVLSPLPQVVSPFSNAPFMSAIWNSFIYECGGSGPMCRACSHSPICFIGIEFPRTMPFCLLWYAHVCSKIPCSRQCGSFCGSGLYCSQQIFGEIACCGGSHSLANVQTIEVGDFLPVMLQRV